MSRSISHSSELMGFAKVEVEYLENKISASIETTLVEWKWKAGT